MHKRHHDNDQHLFACELAQRPGGRWQPQHEFNHERIELLVVVHVILELMRDQFLEQRAALVVALRLDRSVGSIKEGRRKWVGSQ